MSKGIDRKTDTTRSESERLAQFNSSTIVKSYISNRLKDSHWDWKQPISFWGLVVDNNEAPLAEATVDLEWNDMSTSGTSQMQLTTDKNGHFELLGRRGKMLSIAVRKSGYRRCGFGAMAFEYADPSDPSFHIPNPSNRVVFRLLKKNAPEPMVRRTRMRFTIPQEADNIRLDLLGQRAVKSSQTECDLVIFTTSTPSPTVDKNGSGDWFVRIESPNGGVQIASDCDTSAPDSGYASGLEFAGREYDQGADSGVREKWLFLMSRGGKYFARICLDVAPRPIGGGPPVVQIHEYVLNPSGSRNLEFYPEMDVSEKYYVPRDR